MRVFETKSIYDYDACEWIEFYFIDNIEVGEDNYFEEMEMETFEICDECQNLIEDCICDEEYEEECLDSLTEKYVSLLQEACCPDCQKKILISYFSEMLDYIGDEE